MGRDGTLVPGNLVAVAVLGTAGVVALPHLPMPLEGPVRLGSLLAVRPLLFADGIWALFASSLGLLLLGRRHGIDRGIRAAHVLAYAFIIPAGVVGARVFGGGVFDAALAETLVAIVIGAVLPLVRGGGSTMPQGGRGWNGRGEKLGGGLRY